MVRPTELPAEAAGAPLNIVEAAAYLNVTERFMRRMVAERRVAYHKLGKFLRFQRSDLDDLLKSGRVEPPQAVLPRHQRLWQAR